MVKIMNKTNITYMMPKSVLRTSFPFLLSTEIGGIFFCDSNNLWDMEWHALVTF